MVPGEFQNPSVIQIVKDQLFVLERGRAHVFDLKGHHLQTWRQGNISLFTTRVDNGWFFHTYYIMSEGQIELHWSKQLHKDYTTFFALTDSDRPPKTYGIVNQHPIVKLDRTGRFAIAGEINRFAIHIFDLTTLKKIHTIIRNRAPLPMDRDWAKQKIARLETKDPMPSRIKAHIPKYFPFFRDILISPENHLWVQTWSPNPRAPGHLIYELGGKPTASAIQTYEGAKRVLAVHHGKALVCTFENEEAVLYFLPFEKVDAFVAARPIRFDWFAMFDRFKPK